MKISFKNIKSFSKTTSFNLKKLNVIIGPNSSGKSTLNEAIRYFSNLSKFDHSLIDGSSTNFSLTSSYGCYFKEPPKYLYTVIDGKKELKTTHLDFNKWVYLNSPLHWNINDKYLEVKARDLNFDNQKGIRTSIDMYIFSIPSILTEFTSETIYTELTPENIYAEKGLMGFFNPNEENISYFDKDEVNFHQALSERDELKNIEKFIDEYYSFKELTSKSLILIPKDFIEQKQIIKTINDFSKNVYKNAVAPINDKEKNSISDPAYSLRDRFEPWVDGNSENFSYPVKYKGSIHQVFNDAMKGYMYSTNYKLLDGLTFYSSLDKTNKKNVLTFQNNSTMYKLLHKTIYDLSDNVFDVALSNINDFVNKKSHFDDEIVEKFGEDIINNFNRLLIVNPVEESLFISSHNNDFIKPKDDKLLSELHFTSHFDVKSVVDRFYPIYNDINAKRTGVVHDNNYSIDIYPEVGPKEELKVIDFGLHSIFFQNDFIKKNKECIKSNFWSPSYYQQKLNKVPLPIGSFFNSQNFELNITNQLDLEGTLDDDVDNIFKFLKEIGHYKLWSKAFKVSSIKSGRNKYSFISLNPKSKIFKSNEIIKLKNKFEKILNLKKDSSSLFLNGLFLSIVSSTVKSSINNLVEEGILGNPKFILEKYHKNIKKMSKKYRISQKSILREIMLLDQFLLKRIVTWYQSLAYELLMTDYLQLSKSVQLGFNNSVSQFYNIKARLLSAKSLKNDYISEKKLLHFFGNDFQNLINADSPFAGDSRKNKGLLRFQKFINSALKDLDVGYTFNIYPIISQQIDSIIPSEYTGLFKLKLKFKDRTIDLSESGSGDMSLISILGQLFFANEWWIDRSRGINVINNRNRSRLSSNTTSRNKIISIHEPENHLHPKIISKFAEFLFNYNLEEIKLNNSEVEDFKNHSGLIVETHSEIFIRKFQSLTRKMKKKFSNNKETDLNDLVNIFYVKKDKKGSSSVINLGLQNNGFLKRKIPPGFFDINTELISDLWKPAQSPKL